MTHRHGSDGLDELEQTDDRGYDGLQEGVDRSNKPRNRTAWSRLEDIFDQRRLTKELADYEDDL